VQPLRHQPHVGLVDGRHGNRRSDVARVVDNRDDLLALLVVVARIAKPIAPFLATVLVPSTWRPRVASGCSAARGRTLARNACQSAPASAHVAQTLETVVECMAGVPLASVGTGKHFHGIPG
jgi:hypothetical protein